MSVGSTRENRAKETGGNLAEQTELLEKLVELIELQRETRDLLRELTQKLASAIE